MLQAVQMDVTPPNPGPDDPYSYIKRPSVYLRELRSYMHSLVLVEQQSNITGFCNLQ